MPDSIYKQHKPAGSGGDGLFLRLKSDDSVRIRIASPPAIYTQEFTNDGETTLSTKYAWIVWNRTENKAQIFSGGKSIFNQIAELVAEWGEPTDFDVTIKRTGEMLETRYSVIPMPKSEDLNAQQKEEVSKIDLISATKSTWLSDFISKKEDPKMTNKEIEDFFGPEGA